MDPQPTRGLRDVVAAVGKYAMDVLPFGLSQRRHGYFLVGLGHFDLGTPAFEGVEDVVDIGRLGKKIHRSEFDRVDGRCDAAEPRKDQHANIRRNLLDVLNEAQPGPSGHTKVHDGKIRRGEFELFDRFVTRSCHEHSESPFLKSFGKAIAKDDAVVDEHDAREARKCV